MENDSIDLPLDIYSKYLRSIGEIEFTQREVDILACLVGGQSTRTIPSFLSIAARTVASHISRIRLKTGCSSQESIIDFVERSGKALIVKENYYLSLCNQVSFEKQLKRIPRMGSVQSSRCFIVYEREQKDKYSFLHYLEDHLKLAGFNTEVKIKEGQKSVVAFLEELEPQQGDHILYVVPQALELHQAVLGCNEEKCTLLFPDKREHSEGLDNIKHVNFSGAENYYFSVFELLKKLKTDFNFDKIIGDFKKSYEEVSSLPETIEVQIDFPQPATKNIKSSFFHGALKKRSKIVSLVFLTISLVCIGLFVLVFKSNPPHPPDLAFLNRPELLAQIDSKFKRREGIQTVALTGIGGAGKTTLARQYAQSQSLPFVGEVNAETKETLTESFEGLAYRLAYSEEDQKILSVLQQTKNPMEKERKLIQFVKQHLQALSNWFLIYDNVEKFIDIHKYFPDDFHTWGRGRVLITTRNENIQNNKHINDMVFIKELDPKQKFNLFTKIIYGEKTSLLGEAKREEIEKFLEKIPSFPLDVSIAAYYLKATDVPYETYLAYLEYLNRSNKDFERVQKNLLKESGDYAKTRYGIITLSLQHLLKAHKDFKDLLLFISLLDSQKIPRVLLNRYKNNILVDEFIYNLKKYSFIANKSENFSSDSTISMHRSTQVIILAYLVDQLTLEERDHVLSGIVNTIESYMNEAIDNDDFSRFKSFIPHLETFLSHKLLNKEQKAIVNGILGCIYKQLGDYEKSEKLLIKALANLNYADNKNHIKISRDLAFLGLLYNHLGDYKKSRPILEQSYKHSCDRFSENPTITLLALTHLGNLCKITGQYEESLYFLKKGLTICKKYIPQPIKIGASLLFLGNLYTTLGDPSRALNSLTEALEIYKRNVPKDDVPFLWVLYCLGKANLEFGNYKEAQKILEESLRIAKKHYPENDMWVYWILAELGLTHSKLGYCTKGIALLEASLKGYTSHYGQDHIRTTEVLKNLGCAYFAQGNNDIAEKYFRKALAVFEAHKHPERYIGLEGLSDLYLKKANEMSGREAQNLKKKAQNYLQQALDIVEAHFPKDSSHRIRLQSKINKLKEKK